MKQFKKQILTASAIVGLASALSAQVVVTNSVNEGFVSTNTATFNYTVQQASSALVIGFYTDGGPAGGVTGLNFGGVAADGFITDAGRRMHVGYWLNPATGSGTLTIDNASDFGSADLLVGAFELANVDLSAPVTGFNASNSITTLTDNEFVVSFAGANNNDGTAPVATSIIDTATFDLNTIAGGTGGTLGGGAGLAGLVADNPQDVEFTNGDVYSYSFQAVPEPSSFALLAGCFGLTWVMLRRRA